MRAINLDLNIEELILDGLVSTNAEGYLVIEAIERELAYLLERRLLEQGIPPSLTGANTDAQFESGVFHSSPDAAPDAMGLQIATHIADTLYDNDGEQV
jgi:hypothetical protein